MRSWCGPSVASLSATTTMFAAICAMQSRKTSRATISTVAAPSTSMVPARRGSLASAAAGAARQPVAPRRLVGGREMHRPARKQPPRHRVEPRDLARLELELRLADRRPRLAGADLAAVERQLDLAAVRGAQPLDDPLDVGLEDRRQRRAGRRRGHVGERALVVRRLEHQPPAGGGALVLAVGEEPAAAVRPAPPLHRLHPGPPDAAQPERHPGRRQRVVGRVVVDRDQPLGPPRLEPELGERRAAPEPRHRRLVELDLELSLDHPRLRRSRQSIGYVTDS